MDGIKIVLENGYIVGEQEIVQIFDMADLRGGKIKVTEENLSFLEFIYLITKLLKIDMRIIQDYFLI